MGAVSKDVTRRIEMAERVHFVPIEAREMADQSFMCAKMAFRNENENWGTHEEGFRNHVATDGTFLEATAVCVDEQSYSLIMMETWTINMLFMALWILNLMDKEL